MTISRKSQEGLTMSKKSQEGLERRTPDRAARLMRANEQLRHEVREHRHAEELLLKEQRHLRHLLELQDRERQLVAYEIHDGLAQQLAAAIMQLELFDRPSGHNGDADGFKLGLQRLHECMRETRRLINGLRSPILDELGVAPAIEELISQNGGPDAPEIDFVHRLTHEQLAPLLENAVFRIVQESLTNARRYSRSERVLIRLTQRDDYIRIEVQDWGVGFNPRAIGEGHFGLEGIQERARLLGGAVTIRSTLGKGTRIVAQLPLMEEVHAIPL